MLLAYDRLIRDWQACLASAFFNGELDRLYQPSSSVSSNKDRTPGFTEEWGVEPEKNNNGSFHVISSSSAASAADHFPLIHVMDPEHPEHLTILYQHRPAWAEQLVLRVAGLPHVVKNVPYSVSEVSGPLPCLLDSLTEQPPVLIGRHSKLATWTNRSNDASASSSKPASTSTSKANQKKHKAQAAKEKKQHWKNTGNAILDHLEQHHHKRVHLHLSKEPEQKDPDHTYLLHSLVKERLPHCMTILRYKDPQAWYQIHRPQCIASYTHHSLFGNQLSSGLFQTWCERQFALNTLSNSDYHQGTVEWATTQIQEAYDILERHIEQKVHDGRTGYILGTKHMTLTDALLWDHLMQAMVDVHLVGLLAHQYPHLCRYTEHLHELFQTAGFREPYKHQRQVNDAANASNVFVQQHNPLLATSAKNKGDGNDNSQNTPNLDPQFTTALELMQTMAVVKRQQEHAQQTIQDASSSLLQEQLSITAQKEAQQKAGRFQQQQQQQQSPATTTATPPPATSAADEAAKRQHQRGDELWLAGTLAATITAFSYVILSNQGSKGLAGGGGGIAVAR